MKKSLSELKELAANFKRNSDFHIESLPVLNKLINCIHDYLSSASDIENLNYFFEEFCLEIVKVITTISYVSDLKVYIYFYVLV